MKTLLWLAYHGKILTNLERNRRRLTQIQYCINCPDKEESLMHLFKDCPKTNQFWRILRSRHEIEERQSSNFEEWVSGNIRSKAITDTGMKWNTMFTISFQWIWRCRNELIFSSKDSMHGKVRVVETYAKEINSAFDSNRVKRRGQSRLEVAWLRWIPSQHGWNKLNTDGIVLNWTNRPVLSKSTV